MEDYDSLRDRSNLNLRVYDSLGEVIDAALIAGLHVEHRCHLCSSLYFPMISDLLVRKRGIPAFRHYGDTLCLDEAQVLALAEELRTVSCVGGPRPEPESLYDYDWRSPKEKRHLDRTGAVWFLIRQIWNNSPPKFPFFDPDERSYCPRPPGNTASARWYVPEREPEREEWLRSVLGDSEAGREIDLVLGWVEADAKRLDEHFFRNSREEIERRKAEKARERDERLRLRAIRKAEIDRLWWAKHPKPQ